jgi:ABC-type sugar transport system substrate-binding protein
VKLVRPLHSRHVRFSRVALVLTLLIALGAVAATAREARAATSANAPTAKSCVLQARQATAKAKKRLTLPKLAKLNMAANSNKSIWYVAPSLATGYALAVSQGFKTAGDASGMKVTVWDSRGLPAQMASGIERAIADHASVIIIHAISPTLVTSQLKAAAAAKIPVISVLNALDKKNLPEGITATFDPDVNLLGKLMADYALSSSGCKANAGVFYWPASPILVAMSDAIQKEFTRVCKACEIKTSTFELSTMATTLPQQTANFLRANPSITHLIATFDTAATFMLQGVSTAGSKALVVGANGNDPNLEIIRKGGPQISTVAYPPGQYTGWYLVDQAARLIQNQKAATHRFLPIQAIDRTNVGKENSLAAVWPKLSSYESFFKKNWGK